MGDTNGAPQIPLHNVGLKVQLQTIVPSAIRKPNSVGARCAVARCVGQSWVLIVARAVATRSRTLSGACTTRIYRRRWTSRRTSCLFFKLNVFGGVIDGIGRSLPDGWTKVKHPDAGVYYVNEEKVRQTHATFLSACALTWYATHARLGHVHGVGPPQSKNACSAHAGRRGASRKPGVEGAARGPRGRRGLGRAADQGGHADVLLLCIARGAAHFLASRHRTRGGGYTVYV